MRRKFICSLFITIGSLIFTACGPPTLKQNIYKTEKRFPCPQNFSTDIAWVVLEWNGKLGYDRKWNLVKGGYGSGFLADQEKGLFYSNKHVTDVFGSLGGDSHKVFFNCRVYNAVIAKVSPLADAAVFRITDSFDPSLFPAPMPLAEEEVKVGDKLIIEGFHPHPYEIRKADKDRDINHLLVPILKDYYEVVKIDIDEYPEVVFERVEATVTEVDVRLNVIGGRKSNIYFTTQLALDHLFSPGGLSGTRVINENGEIVGIFTAGSERYETNPGSYDPHTQSLAITKIVYDNISATPVEKIKDLRDFIKNTR